MAKKVLIISTSLRGGSNSDILARECERGAKEAGHEVEYISLKGKEIKYSIDDRDMVSYRYGYVKDSYIEIGKKIISNDINIDEMLAYSSDDKSAWYDVVSYSVFMKSGRKTNWIHIDDPDMIQYQPFMWAIELFNLITDKIPSKKFNCGVNWEDLEKHMRENHPEL